jgi:hypothetical protein
MHDIEFELNFLPSACIYIGQISCQYCRKHARIDWSDTIDALSRLLVLHIYFLEVQCRKEQRSMHAQIVSRHTSHQSWRFAAPACVQHVIAQECNFVSQ